jgi:PEP-CTERM motif
LQPNKYSRKKMKMKKIVIATVLLAVCSTATTKAQIITFGSVSPLSTDGTDTAVSNAGTAFDAYIPQNPNGPFAVNGVTFQYSTSSGTGTTGTDGFISYTWTSGSDNPFSFAGQYTDAGANPNAPPDLATLMAAGGTFTSGSTGAGFLTIGNSTNPLIAGNEYQLQLFLWAPSGIPDSQVEFTGDTIGGNAITMDSQGPTGTGTFVTGTFIATGDSTQLDWSGGADSPYTVVGGISVRDLGAVPEPSAYALMLGGLGVLAWMTLRRRQVRG